MSKKNLKFKILNNINTTTSWLLLSPSSTLSPYTIAYATYHFEVTHGLLVTEFVDQSSPRQLLFSVAPWLPSRLRSSWPEDSEIRSITALRSWTEGLMKSFRPYFPVCSLIFLLFACWFDRDEGFTAVSVNRICLRCDSYLALAAHECNFTVVDFNHR